MLIFILVPAINRSSGGKRNGHQYNYKSTGRKCKW